MLSVRERIVRSLISKHAAAQSCWRIPPASSKSEFVTDPEGFAEETREATISGGKVARQSIGCAEPGWAGRAVAGWCGSARGIAPGPGRRTPPHMVPDASWYPSKVGLSGTSSYRRVGRAARSSNIQRKSASAWCTAGERVIRPCGTCRRASCIWLNSPRAPGIASAIERSSPRTRRQILTLVRFLEGGKRSRSSRKRVTRLSGRRIVMPTVSMSHPRNSF